MNNKKNNNDEIYKILNEAYCEFKQVYGEKHSQHIKERIASIKDIKEAINYYNGPIAIAHLGKIIYTKCDRLPAVLKHELWHVYNDGATDINYSLQYIPERYIEQLDKTGYLKDLYHKKMEENKVKWKDNPERLKYVLVDYGEFKNNIFGFGDSTFEMWTEWFNSQTHSKDMKYNFKDRGDGYFTKNHSSGSSYDSYINVADMISEIIPKEKLLDMYLNTKNYRTDYSYPEMLQEFDAKYMNALNSDEKEKYGYPYLKILMDVQTVSENAKNNPEVALEALQSCIKTCFNAYAIKLDNIKDFNIVNAKIMYSEIKYMQEQMIWNVDILKMKNLDSTMAMEKIQEKFKSKLQGLDLTSSEIQRMMETIDYSKDNPYNMIEDGKRISEAMVDLQNDNKIQVTNIGKYKVNIGKKGIKGNLFDSLFTLLGDKKYNLLFEKFQNHNQENELLKFYNQIESARNDGDIIKIYDDIYASYAQKLENNLKTDENIDYLFERYNKEIIKLQENAIFNDKDKKYLPQLEEVISTYNQKIEEYKKVVDICTEKDIKKRAKEGESEEEIRKFAYRMPNKYKQELNKKQNNINEQRDNQIRNYTIDTQKIGKTTIHVSTEEKDKAHQKMKQQIINRQAENEQNK